MNPTATVARLGLILHCATIVICMIAGCNRSPQATFPVKGIVKWADGHPAIELADSTVELQVIRGPAIRVSPHGNVKPDGTFVLRTYQPADGAPSGEYKAIIVPPLAVDDERSTPPSPLDGRFQRYQTTPLKVTIEAKPNELDLVVERSHP